MTTILATVSGAFASIDQDYLLQARQMQALSLAVHILAGGMAWLLRRFSRLPLEVDRDG